MRARRCKEKKKKKNVKQSLSSNRIFLHDTPRPRASPCLCTDYLYPTTVSRTTAGSVVVHVVLLHTRHRFHLHCEFLRMSFTHATLRFRHTLFSTSSPRMLYSRASQRVAEHTHACHDRLFASVNCWHARIPNDVSLACYFRCERRTLSVYCFAACSSLSLSLSLSLLDRSFDAGAHVLFHLRSIVIVRRASLLELLPLLLTHGLNTV